MRVSKVDFQQSEAPRGTRRQESNMILCSGQWLLFLMWKCGKRFWSCCKNSEKAQRICGSETIQKSVLVHPKNKQEKEDLTECVYKVPCVNCDKTYIGKTERKFGVRLQQHRTDMESKTGHTFTRSLRASSLTEHNISALIDHGTQ